MNEQELREKLAEIEHTRWADWQKWVHKQMTDAIVDGTPMFVIPVETVVRWQRQISTPYAKLSDKEKASDMEQVERYWPLIARATREARRETLNEVGKNWLKMGDPDFGIWVDDRLAALDSGEGEE